MSSAKRVFDVLDGKIPDRVPYAEMFIDEKVINKIQLGMSYEDFADYADIDIVTCLTVAEPPEKTQWADRENGIWRDKWGALQKNDGNVVSVIQEPAVIGSMDDLRNYTPPDPGKASVLESAERLVKRFKGNRAVAVVGEEVFAPMQYMRAGLQNLVFDFYDRPELVHGMAEIAADYHAALYRKLIGMGVEIVFLGDDYASKSGPMISPEHMEEFIMPGLRKVVGAVKDAGGYCVKHTDGDIWKIAPLLVSAGVDMLGPLESPYMDLADVRQKCGVGVMGNVSVDLLARGTPDEVRAATEKLLAELAPGGRFILSSGNSISSAVRPENFMAMIETVRGGAAH
jgi:uroporphyrinogen decarboxylase